MVCFCLESEIRLSSLKKLLAVDSVFNYSRLHWDKRITDAVLQTYQSLIESGSIVGRTLAVILSDELAFLYVKLTEISSSKKEISIQSYTQSKFTYNWKQLGNLFSFDILLLSSTKLGSAKIFSEIIDKYNPMNNIIIEKYEMIQYSILVAIQYIYGNNPMFHQITEFSGKVQLIIQQILKKSNKISRKIVLFCCDWIYNLANTETNFLENKNFLNEIILSLMIPAFHCDHIIRLSVSILLKKLILKFENLISPNILSEICDPIQLLLTDNYDEISNHYLEILSFISIHRKSQYNYLINSQQRNLLSLPSCNSFKGHYFKVFMSYLQFSNNSPISLEFLTKVSDVCQVVEKQIYSSNNQQQNNNINTSSSSSIFKQIFESNTKLKWFWVILECTNLFINANLRSHFGNPMQSFAAIEKMLENIANIEPYYQLYNENQQLSSNHLQSIEYSFHTLPCLLQFVNDLEKRIYIAVEGSFCLPLLPCGNSFFVANKQVCYDWFSRMRQPAVICSIFNSSSCDIIYQTSKRLEELFLIESSRNTSKDQNKLKFDAEYSIVHLCKSLSSIHESDALSGIISYFSNLFDSSSSTNNPLLNNSSSKLFFPFSKAIQYQAKFQYEFAINEYKNILLQHDNNNLSSFIRRFIIEQIQDCYVRLSDWNSLFEWKNNLTSNDNQYCTNYSYSDIYLKALSEFDNKNYDESLKLLNQNTNQSIINNDKVLISNSKLKQQIDENLLRFMIYKCNNNASSDCNERKIIEKLSKPILQQFTNIYESLPFELNLYCLACLSNDISMFSNEFSLHAHIHDSSNGYLLLRTENCLSSSSIEQPKLLVPFIKLAKKQSNFQLAKRLISKVSPSLEIDLENCCLLRKSEDPITALSEMNKLIERYSLMNENSTTLSENPKNSFLISSLFLKLAKWFHKDKNILLNDTNNEKVTELLKSGSFGELIFNNNESNENYLYFEENLKSNSISDYLNILQGKCLQSSMMADPNSSKSFLTYSNWCYIQGNYLENSNSFKNSIKSTIDSFHLDDSKKEIESEILKILMNSDDFSIIMNNDSNYTQMQQKISEKVPILSNNQIDSLIKIKKQNEKEIIKFFSQSVLNYFKFLEIGNVNNLTSTTNSPSRQKNSESDNNNSPLLENNNNDHNIISTLRLLKLLAKYGNYMQDIFSKYLQITPTNVWRSITPQLFSRLGHPDLWIQSQVQKLISRIGMEYPQDIIYTVIVGECDIQNDASQQQQYQIISSNLKKQFSQLYNEVHLLLDEFTRLTVLWPEIACTLLQRISYEMQGRIKTMKEEYNRIQSLTNISNEEKQILVKEKYSTIMKLFHIQLSNLLETISRTPETPFESKFQKNYLDYLKKATDNFINPNNNYSDPELLWKPFEKMINEFSQFFKSKPLQLKEISPKLASMKSSIICMPGIQSNLSSLPISLTNSSSASLTTTTTSSGRYFEKENLPNINNYDNNQKIITKNVNTSSSFFNHLVTIQSFIQTFVVLPTKTKPKKLIMIGSDGNHYPYLLKGREDLHLDERIMQFLDVINQIFSRVKESNIRNLKARTFGVIPIGRRSGLIQWVNGSTPIFQCYKQWQKRIQNQKQKQDPTFTMKRPVDQYLEKLHKELKSEGIQDFSINARKTIWPISIMKKVFLEMQNETPQNLLEKEFWCSSGSMEQWWNKTQSFTRSVAVMSMIGYILGLGDRHLDNILIDFENGEIVHIDYNICFERGLKLRIPELIPFRLTSIIQKAFGISGISGTFKISCFHVLKILRDHKETLLTLLQAFVYDPLVDWTIDKEESQNRLQMELNTNLSLLSSRAIDVYDKLKQLSSVSNEIINLYTKKEIQTFISLQFERFKLQKQEIKLNLKYKNLNEEINDPIRFKKNENYKQNKNLLEKTSIKLNQYKNEYLKEKINKYNKKQEKINKNLKIFQNQENFNKFKENILNQSFLDDNNTNIICEYFISFNDNYNNIDLEKLKNQRADILIPYFKLDKKINKLLHKRFLIIKDLFNNLLHYKNIISPLFYLSYSKKNIFSYWIPKFNQFYEIINKIDQNNDLNDNNYYFNLNNQCNKKKNKFQSIKNHLKEIKNKISNLSNEINTNSLQSIDFYQNELKLNRETIFLHDQSFLAISNIGIYIQASILPFFVKYITVQSSNYHFNNQHINSFKKNHFYCIFDLFSFQNIWKSFFYIKEFLFILIENYNQQPQGTQPPPFASTFIYSFDNLFHFILHSYNKIINNHFNQIFTLKNQNFYDFNDQNDLISFENHLYSIFIESKSLIDQLKINKNQQQKLQNEISISIIEKEKSQVNLLNFQKNQNCDDSDEQDDDFNWEDHDEIDQLNEKVNHFNKIVNQSKNKLIQLQNTEQNILNRLNELKNTYSLFIYKEKQKIQESKEESSLSAWIFIIFEFFELEKMYSTIDQCIHQCCGSFSSKLILQNIFLIESLSCILELIKALKTMKNNCFSLQKMIIHYLLPFYDKFLNQLVIPSYEYIIQLIINGYSQIYTQNSSLERSNDKNNENLNYENLLCLINDYYANNSSLFSLDDFNFVKNKCLGFINDFISPLHDKIVKKQSNDIQFGILNQLCEYQKSYKQNYLFLYSSFINDDSLFNSSLDLVVLSIQNHSNDLISIENEINENYNEFLSLEDEFDELISWELRDSREFHTITHERITKRRNLFDNQKLKMKEFQLVLHEILNFELNYKNIQSSKIQSIQENNQNQSHEIYSVLKEYQEIQCKLNEFENDHLNSENSIELKKKELIPLYDEMIQIQNKNKNYLNQVVQKSKKISDFVLQIQKKFADYMNQFCGLVPLIKCILKQMENNSDEAIYVLVKNLHTKYRKLYNIIDSYVYPLFGILLTFDFDKLKSSSSFDSSSPSSSSSLDENSFQKLLSIHDDIKLLPRLMNELYHDVLEVSEATNQQISLWKEKSEPNQSSTSSNVNHSSVSSSTNQISSSSHLNNDDDDNLDQFIEQPLLLHATNDSFSSKNENREQVRNVYAISALKRIKAKLQGTDFGNSSKSSVSQQVDRVIDSATNIDNLCVLYEGWTAWI